MASLTAAYRLSARLAGSQLRGFRTSARTLAAQNFTMPAMSPTMTEGNIGAWKVKEGESFAAGDVLLEIETDKAQMDVEAQEDGKMAKIIQGDSSKAVKVGTRIAVIAEANDDLSTLEIPADEAQSTSSPKEEPASQNRDKTSESQAEAPPSSKPPPEPPKSEASSDAKESSTAKPSKQRLPLLPSVSHLLHENNLPSSEADKIPATGPGGRLLKGDVLAYIGKVSSSSPKTLSDQIAKLQHLDLSNIKLRAPPPVSSAPSEQQKGGAKAGPPPPEVPKESKIGVAVDISEVAKVQERIESQLGVFMPLSTFIARASDVANDDLPLSRAAKPSQDDLFNQILGLDKLVPATSRGSFTPQITALPPVTPTPTPKSRASTSSSKADIIDILTGTAPPRRATAKAVSAPIVPAEGAAPTQMIFSVTVPAGDERRGRMFLQRVKTYLEADPGRLVL